MIRAHEREWSLEGAAEKLAWRARLPGASGYDRAAHSLRVLSANGADAMQLLPLALPTSWLVNARATSHVFQRWLAPPSRDAWALLLERLGPMASLEDWLSMNAERADVERALKVLATGRDGATLCAVTKVLALLRPQLVPLMDDAAIAFAIGAVAMPETAEDPRAGIEAFAPMLDWFARAVTTAEAELISIAKTHAFAVLDAPQVLDRLLWFDSWGHRLKKD
jgi:hypothetical protein